MKLVSSILTGAVVVAQAAAAFADPVAGVVLGPRVEIALGAAPSQGSGFEAALSGQIAHPSDLLDYADTGALATALMGDTRDEIVLALTGPGGIERRGYVLIGDTCLAADCRALQVLIVVDTAERRVFLAWQGTTAAEVIRPAEHLWPIEGQDVLVGWRNAK